METLAETITLLLTNPNIAFILLVLGLWAVVLAVSLPGTGLPEATAVVCLALAAVGLVQLPVNWVGLGLLALSLVLFIAEFQVQSHGALLLAGAVAMGVGALFLFRVGERSEAQLSWVTIVGAPLVSTIAFGLIIRKGLAAQRAPALQDPDRLVGQVGISRTEIEREGTVYVGGELWSATADQKIPPEMEVVVVERKGLILKVAPARPPAKPASAEAHTP